LKNRQKTDHDRRKDYGRFPQLFCSFPGISVAIFVMQISLQIGGTFKCSCKPNVAEVVITRNCYFQASCVPRASNFSRCRRYTPTCWRPIEAFNSRCKYAFVFGSFGITDIVVCHPCLLCWLSFMPSPSVVCMLEAYCFFTVRLCVRPCVCIRKHCSHDILLSIWHIFTKLTSTMHCTGMNVSHFGVKEWN